MALQLNRVTDYMLRCVLHLAKQPAGAVVRRRDIVAEMKIPDALFRKLAQDLKHAGILEITQGARGGLRLAVPPEELTLLAVVKATGEEAPLNECLVRPEACERSSICAVHRVLDAARETLYAELAAVTFADLAAQEACLTAHAAEG
jgi:Rrf2 family protein